MLYKFKFEMVYLPATLPIPVAQNWKRVLIEARNYKEDCCKQCLATLFNNKVKGDCKSLFNLRILNKDPDPKVLSHNKDQKQFVYYHVNVSVASQFTLTMLKPKVEAIRSTFGKMLCDTMIDRSSLST